MGFDSLYYTYTLKIKRNVPKKPSALTDCVSESVSIGEKEGGCARLTCLTGSQYVSVYFPAKIFVQTNNVWLPRWPVTATSAGHKSPHRVKNILGSNLNLWGSCSSHVSDGYPSVTARFDVVLSHRCRRHLPPVFRCHLQSSGCFWVWLIIVCFYIKNTL